MTAYHFFMECSGIIAWIAIIASLIAVALDWFQLRLSDRRNRKMFQGKWSDSKSTHKLYQTFGAE